MTSLALPDSAWRDWYRAQHEKLCATLTGDPFEDYASGALAKYHSDYVNPDPMGRLGDGGSDGLAEAGSISYACYGSRAQQDADAKLATKIRTDLARAVSRYPSFADWRFVTNALVGPGGAQAIIDAQREHQTGTARPLRITLWRPEHLWSEVVGKLSLAQLNDLFPGVPNAQNVDLADLIPLLDSLGSTLAAEDPQAEISPVPANKMSYNRLPRSATLEFNAGRSMAQRVDRWFSLQEPDLRDQKAILFRRVYDQARGATSEGGEILERVYTALGGANFRFDSRRANAVYAVTAYFFDSCDIFEQPPTLPNPEELDATSN